MFLGRVVEPGEPLWLIEDTELELAWQAWREDACPGCGHPRSETFDPDNAGRYVSHRLRCHACAVIDEARDNKSIDRAGLYVHATYER